MSAAAPPDLTPSNVARLRMRVAAMRGVRARPIRHGVVILLAFLVFGTMLAFGGYRAVQGDAAPEHWAIVVLGAAMLLTMARLAPGYRRVFRGGAR